MKVKFKGNKGPVRYRGVSFVGTDAVEVSQEWFNACKSPNVIEVKAPVKTTLKTPAETKAD